MYGRQVKSALRFNLSGRVNGSPCHFACRIYLRIFGVTLDDTLNIMLNGMLDSASCGMLVGIAEGVDDIDAVFACDGSSCELRCR